MERAARLFTNNKQTRQILEEDELARAIWPAAAGKVIAAHTSRLRVVRSTLVVEVEDAIWRKQLYALKGQILDRLRKVLGNDRIQEIEFRVGIPRRDMQHATTLDDGPAQFLRMQDEAETIDDPVLKKVYRLSRKKATA